MPGVFPPLSAGGRGAALAVVLALGLRLQSSARGQSERAINPRRAGAVVRVSGCDARVIASTTLYQWSPCRGLLFVVGWLVGMALAILVIRC